jgi:hypothetical protein
MLETFIIYTLKVSGREIVWGEKEMKWSFWTLAIKLCLAVNVDVTLQAAWNGDVMRTRTERSFNGLCYGRQPSALPRWETDETRNAGYARYLARISLWSLHLCLTVVLE